jgi:signal transduction histidine kinase
VLLRKTAQSSTLRLALVYVGLFSAAIFGLLGYVYWSTVSHLERRLERTVDAERVLLTRAYDQGGRPAVVALIGRRVGDERLGGWYYGLFDAAFAPLAGNLHWPKAVPSRSEGDEAPGAFNTLSVTASAARATTVRATSLTLPNGDHLLLGREVDGLNGFAVETGTALAIAAALFLFLAAAAGISTARRSVSRIETINATSREIIGAGFERRIPLRGTGDEWDELAGNLNAMLDRIEELMATNRQVSDNIAHDLRTPLTRIRSRLERIVAQELDAPAYRGAIENTIGELDGVLQTFASLLRISRIEASERGAGFIPLDLKQLAEEVVELFDAAAEEADVRLVLRGEGPAPIFGDRDLLFDALANLVDNAIKHGGNGGEVCVRIRNGKDAPILSVADHGPGIPITEVEQVFKRFYRVEHSRKRPGNGLGLSLVAAVAHLHGIRIELADNTPGLRAELCFPVSLGTTMPELAPSPATQAPCVQFPPSRTAALLTRCSRS